jgi:HPt (histidine-containing phosphotransfer) domain-containing protein
MGALGDGGIDELQRAFASGNPQDLSRIGAQLESALGGPQGMADLAEKLMGGASSMSAQAQPSSSTESAEHAPDLSKILEDPFAQKLMGDMQAKLDADPELLAELERKLRGGR